MAWPYHLLLTLSKSQTHERHILINRYSVYAQISSLLPILAFLLFRIGTWVWSRAQRATGQKYDAVPGSPQVKHSRSTSASRVARAWKKVIWWAGEDVVAGWGERKIWIVGGVWSFWLLFLSAHRTGDDYLHITKRFGVVAASQFPLHYLLSMKSTYSPLALVFKASHEELNPWHRLSGRIIYSMLFLHASWYLNFFFQIGILAKRLTSPVVIPGLIAFSLLTIIATTSLGPIRRWSYRVFFVIHVVFGVSILPLLLFHTGGPLRIYVSEAFVIFILDLVFRKLDTITGFATITHIPDTKLIKVVIPVPASKLKRFHAAPGQHVYLSIPAQSTPPRTSTPSIHDILFNPFTVAAVSSKDVTLVLRALKGPTTKALETLATLSKANPPIKIEGPLGSSRHFPNFAQQYDRVLLVAGGVGATYILPIYTHLQEQFEAESRSPDRITLIWSIRSPSEASWAINPSSRLRIDDDESVQIHITGNKEVQNLLPPQDGSVELENLGENKVDVKATGGTERPDFRTVVDAIFKMGQEERIAVLVCGPKGMARGVRREVGKWVGKGKDVWFHDEGFGW